MMESAGQRAADALIVEVEEIDLPKLPNCGMSVVNVQKSCVFILVNYADTVYKGKHFKLA